MATVDENRNLWGEHYDWANGGEEWSEVWGGSDSQWSGAIRPRIGHFLPAGSILEIGCGFGRWSRFLRAECDRLTLVDLAERCLDACRRELGESGGTTFLHTNGYSLAGQEDASVDFVFSFDSLVHAEADVLDGYLGEIGRVLTEDGAAFLHHSNLGARRSEPDLENPHWRALSVSAESVSEAARERGLVCVVQEIVDWGGVDDCDALSTIVRPGSAWDGEPVAVRNPHFMGEACSLRVRREAYARFVAGAGAARGGS